MVETVAPMLLIALRYQQTDVIMLRVALLCQVVLLVVPTAQLPVVVPAQPQVLVAVLLQRIVRYHLARAVAAPAVAPQAALSQAAVAVLLRRVAAAHAAVAVVLHAVPAAAPHVLAHVDSLSG